MEKTQHHCVISRYATASKKEVGIILSLQRGIFSYFIQHWQRIGTIPFSF